MSTRERHASILQFALASLWNVRPRLACHLLHTVNNETTVHPLRLGVAELDQASTWAVNPQLGLHLGPERRSVDELNGAGGDPREFRDGKASLRRAFLLPAARTYRLLCNHYVNE